ncbi:MAG: ribonuclease HI [Deltaproteobacteria bacterium]|nr:ribonuclease HI [Deltaproteobacteria bacterium]
MKNDKTKWKRMAFKNNKVWVAMGEDGKPVKKNGKLLIRYQIDQDYEYWVNRKNISDIDPAAMKKKKKQSRKKTEPCTETDFGDAVCIFTDGASSGNPGPAGIGVLMRYGKHEKKISRYIGETTNNVAELEAIRIALLEIKKTTLPIKIFTDSGYAYGLLVKGWKPQKNRDIVRFIKKTMLEFSDLQFIKVKGHAGIEGNEIADALATSSIKDHGG